MKEVKEETKYPRENGVPNTFDEDWIGAVVLCRIPGQAVVKEGEIQRFTPGRKYMKISGFNSWILNTRNHNVVSIVKHPEIKKTRFK